MTSRYTPGDRVRTAVENPAGHTRLPRYARGRRGTVEAVHDAFARPEQAAMGVADPEHTRVYTVAFDAAELWGRDAEARCTVLVEVWEHHLEPIGPDQGDGDA
jgi:nitrile hydratase subunit beta